MTGMGLMKVVAAEAEAVGCDGVGNEDPWASQNECMPKSRSRDNGDEVFTDGVGIIKELEIVGESEGSVGGGDNTEPAP